MYARLIVEAGDCAPAAVDLSADRPATVGRSRENALVVRSDAASRLHCKVYLDDGRWVVRDFGLNGTRLNGGRVTGAATLTDGAVITIGDIRLRFTAGPVAGPAQTPPPVAFESAGSGSVARADGLNTRVQTYPASRRPAEPADTEVSETQLKVDELTALCKYMTAAVGVAEPHDLIRHTLKAVLQQTSGTVAGYLSLDPADPTPKIVLPDLAAVDTRLSRRLTEQARTGQKLVWLYGDEKPTSTDSLASFTDAVCVPLKTPGGEAFAALHLYRSGRGFNERDVRFVEAAAGFLAPTLEAHRGRRKLAAEPDGTFGLIVLDAFTSDAIPVHLLTREAFELYARKLAPGGVIAVHLSNRYLDLPPLVARVAGSLDEPFTLKVDDDHASDREKADGKYPSVWAVLFRRPADAGDVTADAHWQPVTVSPGPVWRDDFSDLLGVWRRGE